MNYFSKRGCVERFWPPGHHLVPKSVLWEEGKVHLLHHDIIGSLKFLFIHNLQDIKVLRVSAGTRMVDTVAASSNLILEPSLCVGKDSLQMPINIPLHISILRWKDRLHLFLDEREIMSDVRRALDGSGVEAEARTEAQLSEDEDVVGQSRDVHHGTFH